MSKKKLYKFTINKIEEIEKVEITPEGTLTKKVKEKVPKEFCLIKPSRSLIEEGEVVYAAEYGQACRAGLLTVALVDKLYGNEGGMFTKEELENYGQSYVKLGELVGMLNELESKEKKTDEDKKKIEELNDEIIKIRNLIQSYEAVKNSIYNNTAEVRARNKSLFWWLLVLLHEIKGDDINPVFGGSSHEERAAVYDNLVELTDEDSTDENKEFYSELLEKSSAFVSLWYMGKATSKEDFDELSATLSKNDELE